MSAPRKFDEETRARAVRLYQDRLRDHRESKLADGSTTTSADDAAELSRLRQENAELRRANEILKTASAFFAATELDRRLK